MTVGANPSAALTEWPGGSQMTTIDEFAASFREEPGYLDYGRVGPIRRPFWPRRSGSTRCSPRAASARSTGCAAKASGCATPSPRSPASPPTRSSSSRTRAPGLMHAMFGLTGGEVLLSPAEFPSITYAAVRASEAHGRDHPDLARDRSRTCHPRPPARAAHLGHDRRRREPRRLPHRVPRRHRRHPPGDRRPAADRRRHPGIRRRRRAVRGRRRRRLRRPEVGARRLGHRLHGAERARARPPHPGLQRLHRNRQHRDRSTKSSRPAERPGPSA